MANYPDYWPKQMRFRDKRNIDDAHRRKTRHSSPGSYHPGYSEMIEEKETVKNIVSKNSNHTTEYVTEYKHISDYVKKSKDHEKKETDVKKSRSDVRCDYLVKEKNTLLRESVFYHVKRGSFSERVFIQDKHDEYILLLCKKYENIGAFYNGKKVKFLGRDYGEDGSLISINKIIGHLALNDKCLNLITNESWSKVLDSKSDCLNRGNTSLIQIRNMIEKLKEKGLVLKVWHFPDDIDAIQMAIDNVESVMKL